MRIVRLGTALLCALILSSFLAPGQPGRVAAEEANVCRAMAEKVIAAAAAACSTTDPNSLCYAHAAVRATGKAKDALTTAGKQASLSDVETISTSAANLDSGEWGIAVMDIATGAEGGTNGGVRAVLFGDATLTSAVNAGAATALTLPVRTFDELPVTLRAGASPNFPQVIRFDPGMSAVADGRNAKGTWVRVRLTYKGVENTVGWASMDQVRLDGDVNTLAQLDDRDIVPSFLYTAPMQAFTLVNSAPQGKNGCAEAASGLLLKHTAAEGASDAAMVRLSVNGAELRFGSATLLLRAVPGDHLDMMAITGSASVVSFGKTVEAKAGETVRVRIGNAENLRAIATPKAPQPFAFAALEGAPAALLGEGMPCLAGVIQGDPRVAARSGPGEKEYTSLFYMNPAQVYTVEGWWADANGAPWWKLANAKRAEHWVASAAVRTLGSCEVVQKVEPGTTGPGAGEGASNLPPGGGGFAPSARTIWDAKVGTDQLVGDCKIGSLNYCAQMVAISPRGSGLIWKGQEVKAYPLTRVRENVYAYNGRNGLNDAQIKLVLVFDSPTSLTMTQTLVLDADPACQHINTFTATIK